MSFLNPGLLGLLALGMIPVALHLLMRPRPRRVLFPALQLVATRRKSNVRRLRLRHIWLLLLRIAVLMLIVLALARPSLPAAGYAPTRGELFRLLAVIGLGGACYAIVLTIWRRRNLARHELRARRSMLNGGVALGVVLLLLLLVGIPWQRRVAAEIASPESRVPDDLPVAAVLLFDTSLSMEYLYESRTRLQVAREFATEQLETFPTGSLVAVAGTSNRDAMNFQSDLTGAGKRLESLATTACPAPLDDRLRQAAQLLQNHRDRTLNRGGTTSADSPAASDAPDRYLREVYIYTDLARSAWQTSVARSLQTELEELPWLSVYVIDVGVENPVNTSLAPVQLSRQLVTEGAEVVIRGTLKSTGGTSPAATAAEAPATSPARPAGAAGAATTAEAREYTVELSLSDAEGTQVRQGTRQVRADQSFEFLLPDVAGSVVQGVLHVTARDPFRADDTRRFTLGIARPPKVLLAAVTRDEANYWQQALAPRELIRMGRQPQFDCTLVGPGQLEQATLAEFDVVCLFSLRRLSNTLWSRLAEYLNDGGGLFVVCGNERMDFEAWNQPAAQALLPGELRAPLRFRADEFGYQYLDLSPSPHPVLAPFAALGGFGELVTAEIRRYWRVTPADDASVLIRYTDRNTEPALIERRYGDGRVLLLTTAVDGAGWSDLPYARWSFVALAHQLTRYLARQTAGEYNFEAGDDVMIPLPAGSNGDEHTWLLRRPVMSQATLTSPANATLLNVPDACEVGHYLLFDQARPGRPAAGFTVNLPEAESDFQRLLPAELDALLGAEQYSISRDPQDLKRLRRLNQLGQEMYGVVLVLLIAVFCLEPIIANRFYAADNTADNVTELPPAGAVPAS